MTRHACLVLSSALIVACSASPDATSPRDSSACKPLEQARREIQSVAAQNKKALETEMQKTGLRFLALPHRVVRGEPAESGAIAGGGLVAGRVDYLCGSDSIASMAASEIAGNARGELYLVEPVARVTVKRSVRACGCPVYDQSCGGADSNPVQLHYEMPAGSTFKGTVRVDYDFEDARIHAAGQDDPTCTQPEPPP